MSEQHNCPHCGASLKKYWHKLTPGLVRALVKVYKVISEKSENCVSKDDLDLTHSEYGNFQKLRFHALIAKYKVDGKWQRGKWLMTKRGGDFLKGKIAVPAKVQTFRNKVVAHDFQRVYVKDILSVEPYFEHYEDFANQMDYFDLPEVLTTAPTVRTIIKKRKRLFCSCGARVTKKIVMVGQTDDNRAITEQKTVCTGCGWEFSDEQ